MHLTKKENSMINTATLASMIRGEVLETYPEFFLTDISKRFRKSPQLVVKAVCESDLVHTLQYARATQTPVTFRGGGFSFNGQTLTEGGILLVNAQDALDFELLKNGDVEVSASTRWRDLEIALNQCGRSVPVLTYFQSTTVGGTLSAGGYGLRSVAYGAQVDQVIRVKLILPDGSITWCSANENRDLFRFALAGQGCVGIIYRAVIRTIPFKPITIMYDYKHQTTSELLESMSWLANLSKPEDIPTVARGIIYPRPRMMMLSCYGYEHTTPEKASAQEKPDEHIKSSPVKTTSYPMFQQTVHKFLERHNLPFYRKHVNLWTDVGLDSAGFPKLMSLLEEIAFNQYLTSLLVIPVRRQELSTHLPFAAHHNGSDEPIIWAVGIYYCIPPQDKAGIEAATTILRRVHEVTFALGGRPYLYGFQEMTKADKQAIYGKDYDHMLALRRTLDPDNLFNAGTL
jgi:FAD/FMN-containing dehydrogenase